MKVNKHAYIRCEQRLKWDKETVDKMAELIYNGATTQKDYHKDVWDYINKKVVDPSIEYRIYGRALFLFQNNRLITVYSFPKKFKKHLKRFKSLKDVPKVGNSNSQQAQ